FASILVHVRSSQSVRKLMDLQPEQATRLDANGQEEEISVDRLQQGDHVRVRPGQRIPIDGKVIQGSSAVDQQLVTGEPLPREINKDDEVIGGSINVNGSLVIEVTRVGEDAFLHKVARQVAEARVMKPGILRFGDRILNIYIHKEFTLAETGGFAWSVDILIFESEQGWLMR